MKSPLMFCCLLLATAASVGQPLCDFKGRDTLFVTVQEDTIYVWDMHACAYCSAQFGISVSQSADTIHVVQTDTTGRLATCTCLFNLRSSIAGIPRGVYWIKVERDLLKKYGYSDDIHQLIGVLQIQYEPAVSPGLSWGTYQSYCNPSSVAEEPAPIPLQFALEQIYPNPFNPGTTIQFRISRSEHVVLKVYDVLGREVQTLLAARTEPGVHTVSFRMPKELNSGIYYCRMTVGSFSQTKTMILLR
jgi:hypothetical protein